MQIKVFNNLIELNMNNAGVRYFVEHNDDFENAFIEQRVSNLNVDSEAEKQTKINELLGLLDFIRVSDWQATYSYYGVIIYYLESVNADQSLIDEVWAEKNDYINHCFIDINGRKVSIEPDVAKYAYSDNHYPVMDMQYMADYFIKLAPKFFKTNKTIAVNDDDNYSELVGAFLADYDDESVHEFVQWATKLSVEYENRRNEIMKKYYGSDFYDTKLPSDAEYESMRVEMNKVWDELL